MNIENTFAEIRARIAQAKSITVLTGAGISADSGVPTFRGAEGLWKNFRPEELASPEAFERDPMLVWQWYNWRRELLATKSPNPGHHALAELEQRAKNFWLITQNVDGLHAAAGIQKLSEIHGNIWKVRCTSCRIVTDNHDVPIEILPYCPSCQGLLRPHIVWFGESLNPEDLRNSYDALQSCEILIIIGTSGAVYPAASFGSVAKDHGAYVIELNLDPTPNSDLVDVAIQGRAKDLVPRLLS
ncbi:NAD-dependent deacylase [Candidatus Nitronereus thalassa]|uniref:NAD-dependent protein deacylase n=1 Tax=Candidatus Nitronereus thalassa TaxID=3020898 RepID=A0ABU3K4W7_9BACT|nr:NAD-dependent deacylase [Candidatus Nitronereus thalassa]MDT7041449.1 NAD-dependent deacylase [Candidatus Nitronereus thalassa]